MVTSALLLRLVRCLCFCFEAYFSNDYSKLNRMKVTTILLLTLLCSGLCLAQEDPEYKPMDNPRIAPMLEMDSVSEAYFGETLSERLQQTRQIEAYRLSRFLPRDTSNMELLEGFRVLDTATLSLSEQQEIGAMLTRIEPYMADKSMKNLCLFLPNFGLRMEMDGRPVNTLVSLKCKMVRFYFEDASTNPGFLEFNIKGNYEAFDQLYAELFPPPVAQQQQLSLFTSPAKDKDKDKDLTVKGASTKGKALYYVVKEGEGWSHVAKNASRQYGKEITMTDLFRINNINTEKALDKQVMLRPGDSVLVGYEE